MVNYLSLTEFHSNIPTNNNYIHKFYEGLLDEVRTIQHTGTCSNATFIGRVCLGSQHEANWLVCLYGSFIPVKTDFLALFRFTQQLFGPSLETRLLTRPKNQVWCKT